MEVISLAWNSLIINPMVNTLLGIYAVLTRMLGPQNMFGLAIIIFTILIKLITYPLTVSQLKSARAMQDMQKSKKWLDIQKKYKDNREKLAQEQMAFYKEMGVSPFSSCLPTLIQFPIIIGLYRAIMAALAVTPTELLNLTNHIYPFINGPALIPLNNLFLWMNLSQPERLYIMGFGVPFLAILVVISTYVQSKLMTPPPQPGEQGAQMAQAMNLYMPFFMGWLAYSFPSGLALYFVASNVVGIMQSAALGKVNWRNLIPALPKRASPKAK